MEKILFDEKFDAVVVGAGHAGCEAALALARLGKKTCLTTINSLKNETGFNVIETIKKLIELKRLKIESDIKYHENQIKLSRL